QSHRIDPPGQVPGGFDFLRDMRDYVGDFEVWKCPGFPDAAAIDDPRNTTAHKWATYFYFPGRTQPAFQTGQPTNSGTPARLDHIENLSRRVLMQDRVTRTSGGWMFNHPAGSGNLTTFDTQSY